MYTLGIHDALPICEEPFHDAFHISKKAVWALLARVYLYQENWDQAREYADRVIEVTPLSYGEDYLSMFHDMIAGEEAIFRLDGTLKSKSLGTKFYAKENPLAIPADTLISLVDLENDLRS